MKTTVEEMAKLEMHSDKWFKAAFEGVDTIDNIKRAAERICRAYGIRGQADPGYIANVIDAEINYIKIIY